MESVGSTHKKQKAEVDIISKLRDSIISHILSCLPTKDAVRTSVLSKRWIDCWTLINKVNIVEDDSVLLHSFKRKKSCGNQHFINFVCKTLLLIKTYNVESFSLVISKKYDATLINAWISCILNRSPKIFHIRTYFELSFSALTSHYLFNHTYDFEELILEMCFCVIKVPSCIIYFTNLKVLKLCGIIFNIDASPRIHLPVLKKFDTKNCSWLNAHDDVTIDAPLLESVLIEQDRNSVFRTPHSCKIKFSASCIKEFTYCGSGGISQPIVLSNSSAARNASVNIILNKDGCESYVQETESCAFILLKQFCEVKCIKFDASEVLTQPNVAILPKFAMLSHLELGSVCGVVLLGLLQKSSVLNTLLFKVPKLSKFNQELLNSAVVPDCLTSTLQVVKFENVRGSKQELFLAKYFMENGMVLERMSLSCVSWCNKDLIEEFKEKLYSFKNGVSFAILEFHY